jgi:transposase
VARPKPWEVSDESWAVIEPLLLKVERRSRYPGRKCLDDRLVLQGILFVLHTGISRKHLPQELGFGSGMTCWRRLAELGIGAAHDDPAPAFESLSAALRTALTPETRARARAVAGTIRTDGATAAAKLLLDAVSRERPPVSA